MSGTLLLVSRGRESARAKRSAGCLMLLGGQGGLVLSGRGSARLPPLCPFAPPMSYLR